MQSGQVAMITVRVSFPTVASWSVKGPIEGMLHGSGLFCFARLTFPSFPGIFLRPQYLSLVTRNYGLWSTADFSTAVSFFRMFSSSSVFCSWRVTLVMWGFFFLLGERLSMFGHCEALTGYVSSRTC
jgi:hypothetical protein